MQLEILRTLSLIATYDWVLTFHISNKSNKQFMLGEHQGQNSFETGGVKLQEKEGNVNLDSVTFQ